VALAEGQVVTEREGRQAEAVREARGGVEEVRGRAGYSVEQVAGKGPEAGGRAHAAGAREAARAPRPTRRLGGRRWAWRWWTWAARAASSLSTLVGLFLTVDSLLNQHDTEH
jgi:hypothetical protein